MKTQPWNAPFEAFDVTRCLIPVCGYYEQQAAPGGKTARRRTKILQRWPVSKRVNSSRVPVDDPTVIEPSNWRPRPNEDGN